MTDDLQTVRESIETSKDFPVVKALIAYLRSQAPRTVTPAELSVALSTTKKKVYMLKTLAKRWLRATGCAECIMNVPRLGYRITAKERGKIFESVKSGNRADGHLAEELMMLDSVNRAAIPKDSDDFRLLCLQEARTAITRGRLELSEKMRSLVGDREKNLALLGVAEEAAQTPWELMGIDYRDPRKN